MRPYQPALLLLASLVALANSPTAAQGQAVDPQAIPEAARLLAVDALIVDTHIDAPTGLLEGWRDLGQSVPDREFDYPRARAGGLDIAFMSIYTSAAQDSNGSARGIANQQIDAIEALVQRHPDKFALLRSPADAERLLAGGRVLLPLGMENGGPIGEDLAQLRFFFDRGIRYITLAHGANNAIADSSYSAQKKWKGLSPFGREVVDEMNRLGIMVDVSHLSDASAAEAIARSRVPVLASHSAFRHFTPGFERNISDELALAVAKRGGVIQVPFGSAFISPEMAADTLAYFMAVAKFHRDNDKLAAAGEPVRDLAIFNSEWKAKTPPRETEVSAVLDQIDYGVRLLGIDHVGIGSDFDGVDGNLPEGLRTVADFPRLVAGLQARGYSEADIRKILGGNVMRVWTAVEAGASP